MTGRSGSVPGDDYGPGTAADSVRVRLAMGSTLKSKLVVLCTSELAGFALLEGVSWYITYSNTPAALVFDDDLIFTARPNSRLWNEDINDIGGIGADVAAEKRSNERRVFLLGGSTSFSSEYVEAVDRAVSALNPGIDVSVVSCGRPRYTSFNNLVNLRQNLLRYEPDVVVCYLGINDAIYNAFPFMGKLPDVGYFDYRSTSSSLFVTLVKYHFIDKRFGITPNFEAGELRSERFLEEHLREIIALGEEHGFRTVLSTFAISHPTTDAKLAQRITSEEALMRHVWGNTRSVRYAVERHNEVIEALAAEFELPLANVRDALPRNGEFFTDMCHMTGAGKQRLGETVGEAIGSVDAIGSDH